MCRGSADIFKHAEVLSVHNNWILLQISSWEAHTSNLNVEYRTSCAPVVLQPVSLVVATLGSFVRSLCATHLPILGGSESILETALPPLSPCGRSLLEFSCFLHEDRVVSLCTTPLLLAFFSYSSQFPHWGWSSSRVAPKRENQELSGSLAGLEVPGNIHRNRHWPGK